MRWDVSAWLYQRVRFLSVCYLSELSVTHITLWFIVYLITRACSFSTYYLCEEEFWVGKSFFLNYIYPILAKQSIMFPNLNGYKEWPAGFHINLILLGCVSHNKLCFFLASFIQKLPWVLLLKWEQTALEFLALPSEIYTNSISYLV